MTLYQNNYNEASTRKPTKQFIKKLMIKQRADLYVFAKFYLHYVNKTVNLSTIRLFVTLNDITLMVDTSNTLSFSIGDWFFELFSENDIVLFNQTKSTININDKHTSFNTFDSIVLFNYIIEHYKPNNIYPHVFQQGL